MTTMAIEGRVMEDSEEETDPLFPESEDEPSRFIRNNQANSYSRAY